jgi:hypothetical protein
MKLKSVALACVAMLACGLPALANQPSFPNPDHLEMVPKECDDNNFFEDGGFVRFVTKNGHHAITFGSGETSDLDDGFNVYPTGMPANNFQLDWNISHASEPYFCIAITTSTTVEYWICGGSSRPGGSGLVGTLANGFTQTLLPNGFTRIKFNGATNGIPAGSKWNLIAVLDFFDNGPGSDTVENMTVNGVPVIPDLHAPNRPPILDCSD